MKTLTAEQTQRFWQEVRAEFPDDRVMQDVHFARLIHREMLRGESTESRVAFFREEADRALGRSPSTPATAL
jgi:hypothetical protein